MNLCYYHSFDLDGHCSGAIIKKKFPDCEMIGINYGEDIEWDNLKNYEDVYMVDFSLQPFWKMVKLNNKCNFIWIDHHKSAMEEDEEWKKSNIKGIRRIGLGACALVWEYLYPDRRLPYGIKLLAEYDVWNHENPDTLPFQYGLRIENTLPGSYTWPLVFSYGNISFINETISNGKAILSYINKENKTYAEVCHFVTEIQNFHCLVINKMITSSQLFDSIWDPEKFDIMIAFGWMNNQWTISFYTTKKEVDVSILAKDLGSRYGNESGGGHAAAAGCQVNSIDFLFENRS